MKTALLLEEKKTTELAFTGKGSELFSIQIVNFFLILLTLGFYYPWAKAKKVQYLYRKTSLAGSSFTFHGTGKEMFIGFIKGIGAVLLLYGLLFAAQFSDSIAVKFACALTAILGFVVLVPVALHGMLRYRTSRTSWRGIHFGYRGTAAGMLKTYLLNLFFTIITLGVYSPWFVVNLRKTILGNIRFGNVEFRYTGDGADLFLIHLKGIVLTIFTLGMYFFWYTRELVLFYIDNIVVVQDEKYSRLKCEITLWDFVKLAIGNFLLIVFTLGLGAPWATARTLSLIVGSTEMHGNFNPDSLVQTEEEFTNALYDDMADVLDIGLV